MRTAPQPRSAIRHDVYGAISDPTRRRIVVLLGSGEQHVNQLAGRFAMTRPAVSQHLRVLRRAGLVTVRRVGRERRYRLRAQPLRDVYDWVAYFEQFWTRGIKSLRKYLDREAEKEKQGAPRDEGRHQEER
jgi:DNA-binding transcriptional ArsR family regulator